ncbi:MAG: hypothetical protein L6V93_02645 [Clostridiales bacterium]|nr:MAG: hypothetical protein L6V93_02645 [Clostridiales bacterium]
MKKTEKNTVVTNEKNERLLIKKDMIKRLKNQKCKKTLVFRFAKAII